MSILIAHYSRTGNNDLIASKLWEKYRCDMENIDDLVDRKGPFGIPRSAFESFFHLGAKLKPLKHDPSKYSLVILCTPAWVGNLPSPMRSYLIKNKNKFRNIAIVSISGKGDNPKVISAISQLTGKEPVAVLQMPVSKPGNKKEMDAMNKLLTVGELSETFYKIKIDAFNKMIDEFNL